MRTRVYAYVAIHALSAVLCGALPASAWAQKLYKHVDEKGVVTYTDRPQEANQKGLAVSNTKPTGDRTSVMNKNQQELSEQEKRQWNINREMELRKKRQQEAEAYVPPPEDESAQHAVRRAPAPSATPSPSGK